jgi:predicted GNAT family acetyltransferase
VVFKAPVGSVSCPGALVPGVWVDPLGRGQALAAPAMAAVVEAALRDNAPIVSLYVNDYNARAIAVYEKVGFERVGTFATILF